MNFKCNVFRLQIRRLIQNIPITTTCTFKRIITVMYFHMSASTQQLTDEILNQTKTGIFFENQGPN